MNQRSDPRRPAYFQPTPKSVSNGTIEYKGYVIGAAEIAEAAMLGWNTGTTAEEAYNKAVRFSMEENSVANADIEAYMAGDGKFTGDKKQVYYERWIAMFKQGMEGWSLYRRTGIPDNLYPAPGRPANYANHNVPPFRSPYPDKQRNLNSANCAPFDAEVVDNLWGKQMWWDTRTGVK